LPNTNPLVVIGIPEYRTKITYVPQRPSLLPGTPRNFLTKISSFAARRNQTHDTLVQAPISVAKSWGIDTRLWDREWSNLSGGEAQRIALAIGVALNDAEVLLLDGT
jgi:ABC-type iron transport system FetAB ATPase subunit